MDICSNRAREIRIGVAREVACGSEVSERLVPVMLHLGERRVAGSACGSHHIVLLENALQIDSGRLIVRDRAEERGGDKLRKIPSICIEID